jgi:hypothetical protein
MKFTPSSLQKFFQFFDKNITESECNLLLQQKGNFSPSLFSFHHQYKIERWKHLFSYIPGITAVFLCNTGAFRASKKDSDIDLFVVTKNSLLWTSRVFLTLLLHFYKLRRHKNHIAGRFCLSFFATETGFQNLQSLEIEKNNDPYLAVWTATLEPLFGDRTDIKKYEKYTQWVQEYGLYPTQKWTPLKRSSFQKWAEKLSFLQRIEFLFLKILKPRTLKKKQQLSSSSGTIISENYLKFHDNDIRENIKNALEENFSL